MTQHHHTGRTGGPPVLLWVALALVVGACLLMAASNIAVAYRVRDLSERVRNLEEGDHCTQTCTQFVPDAVSEIRKPLSCKGLGEFNASRSSTSLTRSAEPWRARKSLTLCSYSTTTPLHQAVPERTRTGRANSISVRFCPRTTTYSQRDLYPIGYRGR